MPKGILIVNTQCIDPTREHEWNRWYSHTHIPDLSKAKGFVRARRFRNTNTSAQYKYQVIYEFDSPNLEASYNDFLLLAFRAYKAGRVIECNGVPPPITGVGPPQSGFWEEINPADFEPLKRHDYSRTAREATFKPIAERLKAAGLL